MAGDEATEAIFDLASGEACQQPLSAPTAALVQTLRAGHAARQEAAQRREKALERLRLHAMLDMAIADLLCVLGLEGS